MTKEGVNNNRGVVRYFWPHEGIYHTGHPSPSQSSYFPNFQAHYHLGVLLNHPNFSPTLWRP